MSQSIGTLTQASSLTNEQNCQGTNAHESWIWLDMFSRFRL